VNRLRAQAACAALLMACAVAGQAQTPAFRTETHLVVLHVTAANRQGELVTNLDRSAFTVRENGKRPPITLFRRDDVPVSLGLLIDNSGSMRRLRTRVEAAAPALAQASNPLDELFVVNFADAVRLDVLMTSDVRQLEAGIARVDSIGGTALRDAIATAQTYLHDHGTRDRRVLVVITDGNDNASLTSLETIRLQAEKTDTVIDAIGLFGDQDNRNAKTGRRELQELTDRTGGVAYFPSGLEQIDGLAVALAHQIRNQYTIAYAPLNRQFDGTYRTVRLAVSGPAAYTVHTRAGYRAVPDAIGGRLTSGGER
jgi:Ca-activated chloride channel family protein